MSVMIVNADEAAKYDRFDGAVCVCTPDGRVLGYFSPAKPKTIRLQPPVSEEELDRISTEGGGRPLADILRDLEKRS